MNLAGLFFVFLFFASRVLLSETGLCESHITSERCPARNDGITTE